MFVRKYMIKLLIIVAVTVIIIGCGDARSGQQAPENEGYSGTESVDIPGGAAVETSKAQSGEGVTEPSSARAVSSEVQQPGPETEHISQERTELSVPALPATGQTLSDFVAEGWQLIDSVELDYNGDGVTDYVGVQEAVPDANVYYRYTLRILFAIASQDSGQYYLDFQDENLIRAREEGGVYGDPYEPLTAEESSFTTHAYGGSAWKWQEENTYSYKEEEWYLTRSEWIWGHGLYITRHVIDDWDSGIRTCKARSEDFAEMEKHWEDLEGDSEGDWEYDLMYEMDLDEPLTLYQAGKRWSLATHRVTDWEVKEIIFAEETGLSPEAVDIGMPEKAYITYCDENCVLYTFSNESADNQWKYYLARYCWQDKSLAVLAVDNADFGGLTVYGDKIYYTMDVIKYIACKSMEDGEEVVKEKDDVIGVRLNRINMDGSGKETVFEYLYPGTDQAVLENEPPYMNLTVGINGGEAVLEVHIAGSVHPVYRMNVDGSNLRQIGQIPKE